MSKNLRDEIPTLPPPATVARIVLVDDHQLMRDGLRLLLGRCSEWAVVGCAVSSDSAWSLIQQTQPDLVLMDLQLPGDGGVALTRRIHATFPEVKVIILTGSNDAHDVRAALAHGACGYILKTNAAESLLHAVRTVLAGQIYLCPEISTFVVHEFQRQLSHARGADALSARETEVLKRLADGLSTKEIAFALSVSTKTVETHRVNVMSKVGVTGIAGLTKYAVRHGLTTL